MKINLKHNSVGAATEAVETQVAEPAHNNAFYYYSNTLLNSCEEREAHSTFFSFGGTDKRVKLASCLPQFD